jgi:glucosamine-6-phosphate deaminase
LYLKVYRTQDDLFKGLVRQLEVEILNNHLIKIGLATGKTMIPIYEEWVKSKPINVNAIDWFILDEFADMPADHPDSYQTFLEKHLWAPLKIQKKYKNPMSNNPDDYESLLKNKNYLDLQLLGIGLNGHVGLNEPGVNPLVGTHFHDLTEQTQKVHLQTSIDKKFVPKRAITQGISTLQKHKKLWLIAWGKSKAEIIERFLREKESNALPATLLKSHPGLSVFLDEDAYSRVKKQIT